MVVAIIFNEEVDYELVSNYHIHFILREQGRTG